MIDRTSGVSAPSHLSGTVATPRAGKLGEHEVRVVPAGAPRVSAGGWLANIRSLPGRLVQWVQAGYARTDFACRRAEQNVSAALGSLTRELARPRPEFAAVRDMLTKIATASQPLEARGIANERTTAAATRIVSGLDLKHRAALLAGVNAALRQGVDQPAVLASVKQALDDSRPDASPAALAALTDELVDLSSIIAKCQAGEAAIDDGAPETDADYSEARANGIRLGVTNVFLKDVARAHFTFEDTDSAQTSLTRWSGNSGTSVTKEEAIEGVKALSQRLGHNRKMLMAVTSCTQGIFAPLLTTAFTNPAKLPDGSSFIPVAQAGMGAGRAQLNDKHWTIQKQSDGSVLVRAEMTQQLNQVQVLDGPSHDENGPTRAIVPTSIRYALEVNVDTEGRFTPISASISMGKIDLA